MDGNGKSSCFLVRNSRRKLVASCAEGQLVNHLQVEIDKSTLRDSKGNLYNSLDELIDLWQKVGILLEGIDAGGTPLSQNIVLRIYEASPTLNPECAPLRSDRFAFAIYLTLTPSFFFFKIIKMKARERNIN